MGGTRGLWGCRTACAALMAWAASAGLATQPVAAAPAGATSTPNDPAFRAHQQWGLVQAGFPTAWCRSTGAGALIVVIDTGITAAQPDLAGKLAGETAIRDGAVTTGPGAAADDSGHGTHVAGIAAAVTGNGAGIAGAAPDARVYAIKVLYAGGGSRDQGSRADLVQAIDYATTVVAPSWTGPVVVNISIGAADAGSATTDALSGTDGDVDGAVERASAAGLGVAVAAGNAGTTGIGGAAVAQGAALSVGALDDTGAVATYSPTSGVSIFVPGGSASSTDRYTGTGILSTWLHSPAGDYAWMAGTSMASPHVAAALALLMSTGMTNQQAYARLLSTSDAQHRLHVDAALDSTAPCGAQPAAPASAVRAVHVAAAAPAAPAATPTAAPASPAALVAPAVATVVRLPATGRVTAATASVADRHPLLGRVGVGATAALAVWVLLPLTAWRGSVRRRRGWWRR